MDVEVHEGRLVEVPVRGGTDRAFLLVTHDEDRTLLEVVDLPPGHRATRAGGGAPWSRSDAAG